MLTRENTTPVNGVGVTGELQEIAARRAHAIDLWDGPIQSLWDSLLWYQEQARRLAERVAYGARNKAIADAYVRCMDTVDEILQEIGKREAEARAQVRGQEFFLNLAKQHSRIDAKLADAWLHQRDPLPLEFGAREAVAV